MAQVLANFVIVVAAVIAAIIALRVTYRFYPSLRVRILSRWDDEEHVVLVLRIANRSRVRVGRPDGKPLNIRLQVLKYKRKVPNQLSEWVPFKEATVRTQEVKDDLVRRGRLSRREMSEVPTEFEPSFRVMTTTTKFDPGEEIVVARRFQCPKDCLLHAALTVKYRRDRISWRMYKWLYQRSWRSDSLLCRWSSALLYRLRSRVPDAWVKPRRDSWTTTAIIQRRLLSQLTK
jgi:hypothetical protein